MNQALSNDISAFRGSHEYPRSRVISYEFNLSHFLFVQLLRKTYNEEGARTGRAPLLLTAAVAARWSTIDSAYDIPEISKYDVNCDFHAFNMRCL